MSDVEDSIPQMPGFFSSREESLEFLRWMEAKRQERMKQLEKSQDNEIGGIAIVYLVIAVAVITLSLSTVN